jgi:TatD DNase family protein
MPGLIDTHCHLDMLKAPAFALAEAREAGLEAVITIGIDLASSGAAVDLASEQGDVWAAVGIHPHEAAKVDDAALAELDALAAAPRVVAIGECGLDYYRDLAPRAAQGRAFVAQLELARRRRLPVVVHIREAADDALLILADHAEGLTVILHCFSLVEQTEECIARGYYASFAGNLTYKTAEPLRAAAARLPHERLLVETDAPFLAPMPFRGKSNHPALVTHTASALAAVRGLSPAELAEVTTANARRVFGLAGGEAA